MPDFTIKKSIGLTSQKSCTLETQAQSEQQQSSRCSDCGYLTRQREHLGCLRKAVAELDAATGGLPQASAGQSAPAGECEAEIERLRMQLVACGVVALANTPKSASEARQMHQDYMSASCSDVANAVDREMTLRQQCDKLAELLDQTITEVGKTITPELRECIDAALAANTGQEVEP